MAQPLDIRVVFRPETGFTVVVEGTELSTAGMENSAVLWGVVRYLVERLPDGGNTDELHNAAIRMTEHFRREMVVVEQPPVRDGPRPNPQLDPFIQQRMAVCPPPEDNEECCICQDTSPGEQWMRLTTCSHSFHSNCIADWMHHHNTCPLCRDNVSRNVRNRRG